MIRRTFLEPAKTNIDSYVSTDIEHKDQARSLKIADCNNSVSLDFSSGKYDTRTVVQAHAKLDKLQAALDRIRGSLDHAPVGDS